MGPPPCDPPNPVLQRNNTVPTPEPEADIILSRDTYAAGTGYCSVTLNRDGRLGTLTDADVSADGSLVALGFQDGDVEVWGTNGTFLAHITVGANNGTDCEGSSGTVRLLNASRVLVLLYQCLRIYRFDGGIDFEFQRNGAIRNAAISSDGNRLASLDNQTRVKVVDLASGAAFFVPRTPYTDIHDYALTPDGKYVIMMENATRFYRLDDGREEGTLVANFDQIGRVTLSDDSRHAFQDMEAQGFGNQSFSLGRYTITAEGISFEAWSCSRPSGETVIPLCPRLSSGGFRAAGDGGQVAWAERITARWQEENESKVIGVSTSAIAITIFDWGAPNRTRGFQAGGTHDQIQPSDKVVAGAIEILVRVFVMPDGSAFAVSSVGYHGHLVHLTRADANATKPSVIEGHLCCA